MFLPSDVVAAVALPDASTAALDAYALPPHLTPALRNALAVAGAATAGLRGVPLTPYSGYNHPPPPSSLVACFFFFLVHLAVPPTCNRI